MKQIILSALALSLTCSVSHAAQIVWKGSLIITAKSGTCPKYDPVGSEYVARYLPAGLGTNGTNSRIALFWQDYAQAIQLNNGSFTTAFKTVSYSSIWANVGSPSFPVQVRFAGQSPAAVVATTPLIYAVGQIKNYDFMAGCTVSFTMSVVKSLEQ